MNMPNLPVTLAYKIIGVLIFIIAEFMLYQYGFHKGEIQTAGKDAIALNKAIAANDKLKTDLEVQRENAQKAINTILDMPVPVPPVMRLAPRVSKTYASSECLRESERTDVLLGRIESIMAADRQRTLAIVGAASKELNSCVTIQKWACSLN